MLKIHPAHVFRRDVLGGGGGGGLGIIPLSLYEVGVRNTLSRTFRIFHLSALPGQRGKTVSAMKDIH